jgi:putative ABC transport system permease protein
VTALLARSSVRTFARHPWQLALCILGVALGVAVVVAVDLANASAERAFELSTEAVVGRATHSVEAGRAGLDEELYREIRLDLGLRASAPVVEGTATALGDTAITMRVLGVDPFAEAPFRARLGTMFEGEQGVDLSGFLTEPRTVVLSASTAERLGVRPGESLELRIGTRRERVRLAGLLRAESEREQRALGDLLVADVATAQELFERAGRLDRIDLILPEGEEEAWLEKIEGRLPEGARVYDAEGRSDTLASMTRAFRLNLTALSLLALIVGMFLIYNAMTFAVVQRRPLIGTLRALGVTRREVFAQVLAEAAAIGAIGSALGLALGALLGRGLVRLVTRTINDLYFVVSVQSLALDPVVLAKGVLLGVGATVLAALVPASEAASASPRAAMDRSLLEERWRNAVPATALGGLSAFVFGGGLLFVSGRDLVLSFTGFFGLVAGAALLTPAVTVLSMSGIRPLARRLAGVVGGMAARGVVAALSRTGVAVAALMTAISVTVGVGIMIDSFRGTVVSWLRSQLQADIYVSPPDFSVGRADPSLERDLVETLRSTPGVADWSTVRRADILEEDGITRLVAIRTGPLYESRYQLAEGDPETAWRAFRDARAVLISEPYAHRRQLGAGDVLRLPTDEGVVAFPVAGVYYDYASDHGVVAMHRSTYETYWRDRGISGLALFLEPGVEPGAMVRRLQERAGPERDVLVQSTRDIRQRSLEIFERTFTITAVLRLLAVVVAFAGVLSALMALQLERAREFGVLRANGLTPGQVWQLVLLQTGLMGLVAGALSLPMGIMLASVMIHVINLRSFGWTLLMSVDGWLLAQAVLVSVGAALLAGLYPAARMARVSPALALREE